MNLQAALFHEDIFSALNTDVMASGGKQKVGHALRPKLSVPAAGEWLSNCLNPTRAEKLDPLDILFIKRIAKQHNSFATVFFEMDEIGMTHPVTIEPDDEKVRLQREVLKVGSMFKDLVVRLEKLA